MVSDPRQKVIAKLLIAETTNRTRNKSYFIILNIVTDRAITKFHVMSSLHR